MTKELKILCMMPFFADGAIALASYRSFQVPGVDFFSIDDNSKPDVKEMLGSHQIPIHQRNEVDQFATGCWNQAYRYFMEHPEYDCLRVGFTDVIMQENWKPILEASWDENIAILPNFYEGLVNLEMADREPVKGEFNIRPSGTPADCVFVSRKLVELSFPVPEFIKLWYNDEYIFTIMRELGYQTGVLSNLRAFHYGSLILQGPYANETSAQIEIDQGAWQTFVRDEMYQRIEQLRKDGFAAAKEAK